MRALIVALATCVLIAGCERTNQKNSELVQPVYVQDDVGTPVSLPGPAHRVVSLLPTVTDLIVAMGQTHTLIARTDYDTDARIAKLPSIGGGLTPSVEWLVAQKPDLVISWPDNSTRGLVNTLRRSGVQTYAARTETIEDAVHIIRRLGQMLNARASADSLVRSMQAALDSTRKRTAGLRPVTVAYVLAIDPPTVAGPRTFIDELITIANGKNVFADVGKSWPQVNLEELLRRDPDVIVLASDTGEDPQQLLENAAGWKTLRAVRLHHVHRVSPDYFNRSGPLMPRAARELAAFFDAAR